jgi:hypothetical protein
MLATEKGTIAAVKNKNIEQSTQKASAAHLGIGRRTCIILILIMVELYPFSVVYSYVFKTLAPDT